MASILNTTFLLRRGYEEVWYRNNPVLQNGEPGFVIDKNDFKIGNGHTPWRELKYIGDNNSGNYGVFNAETLNDFPQIGSVDVIYKASSEKKLYQWNIKLQKYEVLTTAQMEEDEDKVIILYGGSATDNLEATR